MNDFLIGLLLGAIPTAIGFLTGYLIGRGNKK